MTPSAQLHDRLSALEVLPEGMIRHRVAELGKRSLKGETQRAGIDLAIACIDLTTLEGADTVERVRRLALKAARPDVEDGTCPSVAAVCVYPNLVSAARSALDDAGAVSVAVASVATGFPAGLTPLDARQKEIDHAIDQGATEIDTVIDRSAFLSGDFTAVFDRVRAEKEACGSLKLKVILETAELDDLSGVWRAAWLAMWAGADMIKTSTGKGPGGATLPVSFVMAMAAERGSQELGRPIGVKISGGVKTAKDALKHLTLALDQRGPSGISPGMYRIGASSLLDDLLAQRKFHSTGRYHSQEYFPLG
jgi:deoxyribose-phosphate aldolase